MTIVTRITYHPYGPGTIIKAPGGSGRHAAAVVQFDSGKRYVCYARRLRVIA